VRDPQHDLESCEKRNCLDREDAFAQRGLLVYTGSRESFVSKFIRQALYVPGPPIVMSTGNPVC
jgi:hypothetical protein